MPAIRGANSKRKCRRHAQIRGLDAIATDLTNPHHLSQYKSYKGDASDLPAGGLHYCIECAKWFDSDANLVAHAKGKVHKRRVKDLKELPPSQREVEEAVGLGVDDGIVTRRRERENMEGGMEVDGEGKKG
jgi:bud site selection protein 20